MTSKEQLRAAVEQEINAVAARINKDDMPETMGILIPSLDLQRAIDRVMKLIQDHTDNILSELEGKLIQPIGVHGYFIRMDGNQVKQTIESMKRGNHE